MSHKPNRLSLVRFWNFWLRIWSISLLFLNTEEEEEEEEEEEDEGMWI
jgi:hypothetical protein